MSRTFPSPILADLQGAMTLDFGMPGTSTVGTGTGPGPAHQMMQHLSRVLGVEDIAALSTEAVEVAWGPGVPSVRMFPDTDAPLLVASGPAMHDREGHEIGTRIEDGRLIVTVDGTEVTTLRLPDLEPPGRDTPPVSGKPWDQGIVETLFPDFGLIPDAGPDPEPSLAGLLEVFGQILQDDAFVLPAPTADGGPRQFRFPEAGGGADGAPGVMVMLNPAEDLLQVLVNDQPRHDTQDREGDSLDAGFGDWGWLLDAPWSRVSGSAPQDLPLGDRFEFLDSMPLQDGFFT